MNKAELIDAARRNLVTRVAGTLQTFTYRTQHGRYIVFQWATDDVFGPFDTKETALDVVGRIERTGSAL